MIRNANLNRIVFIFSLFCRTGELLNIWRFLPDAVVRISVFDFHGVRCGLESFDAVRFGEIVVENGTCSVPVRTKRG